ncbi:MAG: hypothetical protein DRJ47_04365 [Thermoprotei archaeon]|nr:MAG: hypothetical protein DRJ47_04365 [Thermoprotei archaeon]
MLKKNKGRCIEIGRKLSPERKALEDKIYKLLTTSKGLTTKDLYYILIKEDLNVDYSKIYQCLRKLFHKGLIKEELEERRHFGNRCN